ncbi:MAG: HAD family hydrolase [Acutalibacteraceae bacterium]|nr:HAD family hydrolase [Acutalibacteraceae bacterium]
MQTFLFDFDGTLVDSMPSYVSSTLKILEENNISYGDDIIKIITPLGLLGAAKYFIKLGVKKTVEEIVEDMKKYMLDDYFYTIPAKTDVIQTLKKLKSMGANLNVLTASPHITLDACLKRLEIYDLFTHIWSCDDFGTTKADPEIYKMAAEKIGERVENILFLDDNLNADVTAKKAGMKVCGVYDKSSDEYTEEIKEATDYYIYNFSELLEIV